MWEMSNYNLNNNNNHHHHLGLGFNRDKFPACDGGGGDLGNHQRHSISFQSGDMNINSSGKFPVGVGGMLGISSKAPAVSTACGGGGGGSGGGGGGLPLNSVPGLNPDVELAVEWSPDEQAILEDGLVKYADEPNILKYIKISATLPEKTVRDVALRCRWMTKKENGKRRKSEEYYTGKKMKDKKEKPESSSKTCTPSAPPLNMGAYSLMMHHRDQNDRISCEGIGGTTRHLLDENAQVFGHITANLATFKLQENIDLFCRTRNNIVAIINDMRAMPGIMSQMPPLPVSINDELANIILPNTAQPMIYCPPTTMYGKPDRRC